MKKLLLTLGLVLMASTARADLSIIDALKQIPALKQGVAFSIQDSQLNYLTTVDIMRIKGFNLEAGVAADAENTEFKAVAVLSYDLWNAKKAGIDIPILDLIDLRPGVYFGAGRIEGFEDSHLQMEGDWGLSLTALAVKF